LFPTPDEKMRRGQGQNNQRKGFNEKPVAPEVARGGPWFPRGGNQEKKSLWGRGTWERRQGRNPSEGIVGGEKKKNRKTHTHKAKKNPSRMKSEPGRTKKKERKKAEEQEGVSSRIAKYQSGQQSAWPTAGVA